MTFVTDQMEEALTALQTVKPHDYAGAYYAAYLGVSALDPRVGVAPAELIYGRSLALRLWTDRMSAANHLRHLARAASSSYLAAS